MPTFIWNINPEMAGHTNIFGTSARSASTASARASRSSRSRTTSRRSRSSPTASPTRRSSAPTAIAGQLREVPVGQGRLLRQPAAVRASPTSAPTSARSRQKGAQLIFTCIDGNESLILGKELVKQHVNAVQQLPERLRPEVRRRTTRSTSRAPSSRRSSRRSSTSRSSTEAKQFMDWMSKDNLTVTELSTEGWIAAQQFVHGLKLAGPELHPAEAHRLAQPGHRLRRRRHDRADQLDVSSTTTRAVPTARRSRSTRASTAARRPCACKNGKFVPVDDAAGQAVDLHDGRRRTRRRSPRSRCTGRSNRVPRSTPRRRADATPASDLSDPTHDGVSAA